MKYDKVTLFERLEIGQEFIARRGNETKIRIWAWEPVFVTLRMCSLCVIFCPECDEIIIVSEGEACQKCGAAIPDDEQYAFRCEALFEREECIAYVTS